MGITSLEQLENFSVRPGGGRQQAFATLHLRRHIEEAKKKREALEAMPSDTPEQIALKAALYAEAEEAVTSLNAAADALVAVELKGLKGRSYETERESSAEHLAADWGMGPDQLRKYSAERLSGKSRFHWAIEFPEICMVGGFHAFLGNPPFLGGKRISTVFGDSVHDWLKIAVGPTKGAADLCAYFFLRAEKLLRVGGSFGLLATNTICQGDTREVALAQIEKSASIFNATQSMPWPGMAGVDVAVVHVYKGNWAGLSYLAGNSVESISSYLTPDKPTHRPYRLCLPWYATKGTYVHGEGFILSQKEYADVLKSDKRNIDCLRKYLVAQDFTSDFLQRPSRWAICFGDMDEQLARQYPVLFNHVEKTVRPHRDSITRQVHERCFWKHWDRRDELYRQLDQLDFAIVCPEVSKHCWFEFVPTDILFSHMVNVIASDKIELLALLQSEFHVQWAWQRGSTMRNAGIRYTTKDCFYTFPFPDDLSILSAAGTAYHSLRRTAMTNRREGLTKIYNRFHDLGDDSKDIVDLRHLHVEMDQAVSAAYRWQDVNLEHGFRHTKQGIRYTISEEAHREILDRLLRLNRQRHAEEEAEQSAHPSQVRKSRGKKKSLQRDLSIELALDLL